ncbi:glycosyltransferase family 25 protein [Phyllobacterium sp. TAF24]|uniref:glycosyltransferase family 25 protein n=1 Tax=Phyllobacterium sp. TAF24 TaxID=3233068 RepID=UPI003F97CA63
MKCYLINMDRSTERLARMEKLFTELGIAFERVAAVDGRLITDAEMAELVWQRPDEPAMTRSEVGCYLSHRKCFELIAEGETDYAAIFEDDATLSPAIADWLQNSAWLPTDADIIKLETTGCKVLTDKPIHRSSDGRVVARLLSTHNCTAGYIISKRCATRLWHETAYVTTGIDELLFNPDYGLFAELIVYQISPALCKQAMIQSTIDRYEVPRARPFARIMREGIRPFRQAAEQMWRAWIKMRYTQSWNRVPFV